jgi:serine-type D-Ala-D-Ala carboxypeptidase/endopeptidase (penicillin-binding protein 4)
MYRPSEALALRGGTGWSGALGMAFLPHLMRRLMTARWLCFLLLLLRPDRAIAAPIAAPIAICPAELPLAITAIINRPAFARSRWGILVQTAARPQARQTLYAREADRYFIPASNAKLLTTAAALKVLGPRWRWRTSIYGVETTAGWQLHLVGRGDPSLTATQLQQLVQQLQHRQIRHITELIADDAWYQGELLNPKWAWGDLQTGYGAPANSLILDENLLELKLTPQQLGQRLQVTWENPAAAKAWQIVNQSVTVAADQPEAIATERSLTPPIVTVKGQLRVGGAADFATIAIVDPAQHFLTQLQQTLAAANIRVDRATVITQPQPLPATELAFVESAPLVELIKTMNHDSNNIYAESLLRSLGTLPPVTPNQTTLALGLTKLKTTLTSLGVDPTGFSLADGAGLSRYDLVSPTALVQTLQAMIQQDGFRASLPVAGQSGTLEYRFRGTPAVGIVQAKTGTLSGAVALSGYVNPPHYSPLVFSLILNHEIASKTVSREAIDDIVVALTRLRSCDEKK